MFSGQEVKCALSWCYTTILPDCVVAEPRTGGGGCWVFSQYDTAGAERIWLGPSCSPQCKSSFCSAPRDWSRRSLEAPSYSKAVLT